MCAQLLSWFHLINRKLGGKPRMYAIGPDWDSTFPFVSGKLSKLQDRIVSCKNWNTWPVNLWSEISWLTMFYICQVSLMFSLLAAVKCFEFFSRPKFRLITYLNKQILDPCFCQACEAVELKMWKQCFLSQGYCLCNVFFCNVFFPGAFAFVSLGSQSD